MRDEIATAVSYLQAGELVAFPTETVYGLGADAANAKAVARIFAAKERPADHPLIVHIANAAALTHWARDIPPVAWALADAFWPGPLTLILARAAAVPDAVTGGQDTVGLRVPAHPVALKLLHAFAAAEGGANAMAGIAAPSANRFGRISPTLAAHVREELGDKVAQILDGGACAVGIESTILDLSRPDAPPRILRPGHISAAQIAPIIAPFISALMTHALHGEGHEKNTALPQITPQTPRVSGSLDAHYAPRTPLRLLAPEALRRLRATPQAADYAWLCYSPEFAAHRMPTQINLPAHAEGYAHGLYAALRDLDQAAQLQLIVEAPPKDGAWSAIADRLRRAACGSGIA